ncbi:hypothetical protein PILCRDRAFT_775915, partial [Piloderma croceum F 1598]
RTLVSVPHWRVSETFLHTVFRHQFLSKYSQLRSTYSVLNTLTTQSRRRCPCQVCPLARTTDQFGPRWRVTVTRRIIRWA